MQLPPRCGGLPAARPGAAGDAPIHIRPCTTCRRPRDATMTDEQQVRMEKELTDAPREAGAEVKAEAAAEQQELTGPATKKPRPKETVKKKPPAAPERARPLAPRPTRDKSQPGSRLPAWSRPAT